MSNSLQPLNCSTPDFPVLHYHLEFVPTPVLWCHPAISSSVTPFFSCPQSFQASGSFPVSRFFTLGGQSTGASVSVLLVNILVTGLISLLSKGLSGVFSNTKIWKHHFFSSQPSLCFTSCLHMTTGKPTTLTIWTFVGKVMSLLFNMLSRFVIAFLPRRKYLLIHGCSHHLQWFWSQNK